MADQSTDPGGTLTSQVERDGIPSYVTAGDEQRWRNAQTVARQHFGDDDEQVWSATRVIYHDRENFPD